MRNETVKTGRGRGWDRTGLRRLALVLAAGLSACAQVERAAFTPPPVNPSSPIAAYADQVSREHFPTPSFRDVPPKVSDVPTPAAYKSAVIDEVQQRRAVAAWLAQHPQINFDAEPWAEGQKGRIPAGEAVAVPAQHDAEAEAFAKRLREAAEKPQQ